MRTFHKPVKLMFFSIGAMLMVSAVFLPLRGAHADNTSSLPCVQQSLRRGNQGDCVRNIQTMLNQGNNAGLAVDGKFGPLTQAAVTTWQQKQKATKSDMQVDGIVGSQTWSTFCANYNLFSYAAKTAGCVKPATTPSTAPTTGTTATPSVTCKSRTFSASQNTNDICNSYIKGMLNAAIGTNFSGNTFNAEATRLVRFWQAAKQIHVDGIVGPETWGTLCTYNDFDTTATHDAYVALAKKAGCN